MSQLVERVAKYIRAKFEGEGSGHDWLHIERVWHLARHLAEKEGASQDVAELAALVHDIADWKFHDGDDTAGPRAARALLQSEGAEEAVIEEVVDIVATISYKGAGVTSRMKTLAGQCVQDADRLDAIGAVGIARCFAYGGHVGRPMYDPEIAPVLHQSAEAYKASQSTAINHFHEKLLLLKDRMNTASGRLLAEERHRFMEDFLVRFHAECAGEA